ncbi:hypothetical protein AB0M39_40235 [Streptomyces sp. NPDC051907]|uniref:hypothetical protein n=1 Tax=Streptomyces sp. NPDC051907 TaxID=3155284 RepID=UPI00344109C3
MADTDKAVRPRPLQRFRYQRAGAHKVFEVPGVSPIAMMSHPGITTRLIETAASAAI